MSTGGNLPTYQTSPSPLPLSKKKKKSPLPNHPTQISRAQPRLEIPPNPQTQPPLRARLSGDSQISADEAKMFYGAMVWDPWLIVSQIVCLQCLYYLALGLLMALLVGTRVPRLTLLHLFDFATLTPRTPTGWCAIASFLLVAFAGAGFMIYVIERAKKCLDFAATLYIIHLFICIIYGGWPASITWWLVNIVGLAIMSLLGEYLCIRRELKEIPVSRLRASV